jgi:hypothetical protein
MNKDMVLGIDFGGVINDGSSHPSGDDTVFLTGGFDEAMATPAVAGAIDAIGRLSMRFEGRIWIVSKCGPRIQERTEQWLKFHQFFDRASIDPDHIRFCRQRPEKAVRCAELGVTHFIDDRADVLEHMLGTVEHLYLFGDRSEGDWPNFLRVSSWSDVECAIDESLYS